MIVAVLLLAVGALAAAAAHVSRSGVARGDISLRAPLPDRVTKGITTPDVRPVAPLFAGGSAARVSANGDARGVAGTFVPGAAVANGRRFDLVRDNRRGGSSSFRDFAGERSRRGGNSGGGSGGSGIGGAGGFGGGGVSGTAPASNANRTGSAGATAASGQNRASGSGSRANGGSSAAAGNAGGVAAGVAAVTPGAPVTAGGVIATSQIGPIGGSPGPSPTPEPLTLLLVGSGLAGLYGVRKHLAG